MSRLVSVLFWSVIAAAFIGPGTVTTAASAGVGHGYRLLWALTFSTVACLVLQEASARLTVVSGRNLGEALRERYPAGLRGTAVLAVVVGGVVVGCAAYQAGNILGGAAGAALAVDLSPRMLALVSGLVAFTLLWFNNPRRVAILLSLFVAVMGATFLYVAARLAPPLSEVLRGGLVPTLPAGAGLLALGLVGTTVVPYNLFLGSGIARGQGVGELRFGLAVAVGLGGLISMAVLVVGAAVPGPFSFAALSDLLAERLGPWGARMFAGGLFAAGLSSAITAPLAAAVTARSLFARGREAARWHDRSWRFRGVWLGVLAVGLGFGLSEVRPVPAIILAQALNGILLPAVALFLLLAVNDRRLMGERHLNGALSNAALAAVVPVTLVLGLAGLGRAAARALGRSAPSEASLLWIPVVVTLAVAFPVVRAVRAGRRA